MQSKLGQRWLPPHGLRFLVIAVLLGVFFRFAHLDRKVYWYDETRTSIRAIAAYRPADVVQVFDNRIRTVDDLLHYQRVDDRRSLVDSLAVMAADDPKHTPLYYTLVGWWARTFGDSIATIRLLSALISLLVFPCLYWLGWELFNSAATAGVAVALLALSPFHVLYAQEARHYGLAAVATLLSSAALLRSLRVKSDQSWAGYALTVTLGFYSFVLFSLVLLSHAIYLVGSRFSPAARQDAAVRLGSFKLPTVWIRFSLAAGIGTAAFTPWAAAIAKNRYELRIDWLAEPTSFVVLIKSWILGLSSVFFDPSGSAFIDAAAGTDHIADYAMRSPLLLLIGYALYWLYRSTPKSVWLFVFALSGVTAIALVLPDLLLEGRRSSVPRYLTPCYLGIQLAVAHLLTTQKRHQKLWRAITALLLSAGVLSCWVSSQADAWWTKTASYDVPQLARLINQAESPLLISTYSFYNSTQLLSLSHRLEPKVKLQLLEKPDVTHLSGLSNSSDVFLYNPDKAFQQILADRGYQLEPIHDRGKLWRLTKDQD